VENQQTTAENPQFLPKAQKALLNNGFQDLKNIF
jgi:hypothetical protein